MGRSGQLAHCFTSQFYHACDQPGEAVLCILSYDTLQYCDFLGSGASTWVTILCMARLKTILKQVSIVIHVVSKDILIRDPGRLGM